jgi:hypothetical protein
VYGKVKQGLTGFWPGKLSISLNSGFQSVGESGRLQLVGLRGTGYSGIII